MRATVREVAWRKWISPGRSSWARHSGSCGTRRNSARDRLTAARMVWDRANPSSASASWRWRTASRMTNATSPTVAHSGGQDAAGGIPRPVRSHGHGARPGAGHGRGPPGQGDHRRCRRGSDRQRKSRWRRVSAGPMEHQDVDSAASPLRSRPLGRKNGAIVRRMDRASLRETMAIFAAACGSASAACSLERNSEGPNVPPTRWRAISRRICTNRGRRSPRRSGPGHQR